MCHCSLLILHVLSMCVAISNRCVSYIYSSFMKREIYFCVDTLCALTHFYLFFYSISSCVCVFVRNFCSGKRATQIILYCWFECRDALLTVSRSIGTQSGYRRNGLMNDWMILCVQFCIWLLACICADLCANRASHADDRSLEQIDRISFGVCAQRTFVHSFCNNVKATHEIISSHSSCGPIALLGGCVCVLLCD